MMNTKKTKDYTSEELVKDFKKVGKIFAKASKKVFKKLGKDIEDSGIFDELKNIMDELNVPTTEEQPERETRDYNTLNRFMSQPDTDMLAHLRDPNAPKSPWIDRYYLDAGIHSTSEAKRVFAFNMFRKVAHYCNSNYNPTANGTKWVIRYGDDGSSHATYEVKAGTTNERNNVPVTYVSKEAGIQALNILCDFYGVHLLDWYYHDYLHYGE